MINQDSHYERGTEGEQVTKSIMASGHGAAPHQHAEEVAAPTSVALKSKNPLPTGSRPHMTNDFDVSGWAS